MYLYYLSILSSYIGSYTSPNMYVDIIDLLLYVYLGLTIVLTLLLVCLNETNTTLCITLTWPSTPVGETSTLSCPNTNRSATRNCSVGGVWEQPYVCDCLTQGISQQLCNVCDSIPSLCTVVVLMLLVPSLPSL